MTRRIQRQRETFAYRVAAAYPRDYSKTTWTPEEEALAAELGERLQQKGVSGLSADNMTEALQELILMRREREEAPWSEDYDKAYNDWEAGHENDKLARRIATRALTAVRPMNAPDGYDPADYDPHDIYAGNPPHEALLSRLEKKFMGWYQEHGQEHLNYAGRGPLGNWHQIEQFLKMHYPEAHRGITTGYEQAGKILDTGLLTHNDRDSTDYCPKCYGQGRTRPGQERAYEDCEDCGGSGVSAVPLAYATGPEAVAQHGYDPKEIAAGMLLLHNRTHDHRGGDIEQAGVDRLYDIAKKRSEMQRAYEQKTAYYGDGLRINPNSPTGLPLLGDPTPELTGEESQELYDQRSQADVLGTVNQEFHDWAYENNKENPYDEEGSPGWHGEARGPIGYWPHVEDFLKEKYPAAHRGLSLGMEDAGYLLDVLPTGGGWDKPSVRGKDAYETGIDAVEKHGYDPKEIVAALMLLHNNTSLLRRKKQGIQDEDLERLHDIAARRYKMQRQYEEANGGRRSPRDDGGMTIPRPTIQQPCVWCGEEAKGHSSEGLCKQCMSEAGKTARTAMPVPRNVPSNHITWQKQRDKLNEKAQKAGVPVELTPNFPMDINDFYDRAFQHEETGRPGGWYNEPVEYEGKGVPGGISHRYLEVGNGKIPVNYLLHHGDDGRINGILSHFPEGSPFEKPGSITVTVHPSHRDKGIGSKLVNTAVDKFGVDLEQQQYTPLGYELYRNVKHQQGETVPNIFNEPEPQPEPSFSAAEIDAEYVRQHKEKNKVAAITAEDYAEAKRLSAMGIDLPGLKAHHANWVLKERPINPKTGQPHTPESARGHFGSGIFPYLAAFYPGATQQRMFTTSPAHNKGVDEVLHDLIMDDGNMDRMTAGMTALHAEQNGQPKLVRAIMRMHDEQQFRLEKSSPELQKIMDDARLLREDIQKNGPAFAEQMGYSFAADPGMPVMPAPAIQPQRAPMTPPRPMAQPFATTPMPTPMPQRNPMMPQQPPMSESDAIRLEIQRGRAASAHDRDEVRNPPEDYVGEHREPDKSLSKKLQDRYEKFRTEDFFDFLYNVSSAPIPGVTASRLTIAAALECLAE